MLLWRKRRRKGGGGKEGELDEGCPLDLLLMTTWVRGIVRASRGTSEQAGQGLDLGQGMEGEEGSAGGRTGTLIGTVVRSVAKDRSRLDTGGRWVDCPAAALLDLADAGGDHDDEHDVEDGVGQLRRVCHRSSEHA